MFALLLPLFAATVSAQVTVSVSSAAPSGLPPNVSPDFVAWAFEERSWYYFAGAGGSPVAMTNNLINAVATRTSATPFIRVGGSSLNAATFDASQTEALVIPSKNADKTIPYGMTIGPSFFSAFNNVKANYQLDIPMTKKTEMANSVAFAQSAWNTIGASNIELLELGNEVNSYGNDYTPSDYATQFNQFSSAISSAVGISTSDQRWQVGSLTNGVGAGWNATIMFGDGLSTDLDRIKSFSAHYYQFSVKGDLDVAKTLMNHGNIVSKMAKWQGTVEYLASLTPSIPLNFAEVGDGLGQEPDGTVVYERSFGAALWQVDFMLYAMSIGVHRVNMQSGLGFSFSQFEPVAFNGQPAAVFANLYASLFVADFISTSGSTQALNVDLNDDSVAAYAAYESGALARVALVNFNFYNGSDSSGDRSSETFAVQAPAGVKSVTVMRLTSDLGAGAMDSSDITWGGQSWTAANNGQAVAGTNDTSSVAVSNGYASITVMASEAVMVLFSGAEAVVSSSTASTSGTATSTATVKSTVTNTAVASASATGAPTTATGTGAAVSAKPTSAASSTRHAVAARAWSFVVVGGGVVAAAALLV